MKKEQGVRTLLSKKRRESWSPKPWLKRQGAGSSNDGPAAAVPAMDTAIELTKMCTRNMKLVATSFSRHSSLLRHLSYQLKHPPDPDIEGRPSHRWDC